MKQITVILDNPSRIYTISVERIVKRKPVSGALRGMPISNPCLQSNKETAYLNLCCFFIQYADSYHE